jgi:hypothetical protein
MIDRALGARVAYGPEPSADQLDDLQQIAEALLLGEHDDPVYFLAGGALLRLVELWRQRL